MTTESVGAALALNLGVTALVLAAVMLTTFAIGVRLGVGTASSTPPGARPSRPPR